MYNFYGSCWIAILVLPIYVLEESIIKTPKIHKLFIQYSNNIYFSALDSS